jgi:GTP-binding protein YchF
MQIGITGFPRSGKTTVFQALAPGASPGRDVTFGSIKVPDARVQALAEHYKPKKTLLTQITFVDIAGVPGATSKALEGKTIAAMRNVAALVHVVRVFDDPAALKPADPERDIDDFDSEIILYDLELTGKQVDRFRRENRKGLERDVVERLNAALEELTPLREVELSKDEQKAVSGYQFLSMKPLITLYNLGEDQWADPEFAKYREACARGARQISMAMSAGVECDIAAMDPDDQAEFLEAMELDEPARDVFIRAAYTLLDLISFLTSGPDECRAWTVRKGSPAPVAAGKIHSDLERGFIRAEVLAFDDFVKHGSEAAAKAAGVYRVEGKSYIVQDGDILNIRHSS